MRVRDYRHLLALVLVGACLLALPGCGSSEQDQRRAVAQTLVDHLQRLHEGDFAGACALIDETIRNYGQPCEQQQSELWPQPERDGLREIAVDSTKVVFPDDTHAQIPADAITFAGKPSPGEGYQFTQRDGRWFLS